MASKLKPLVSIDKIGYNPTGGSTPKFKSKRDMYINFPSGTIMDIAGRNNTVHKGAKHLYGSIFESRSGVKLDISKINKHGGHSIIND